MLYANTLGSANTATGYSSLRLNQTGYNNTANGRESLSNNNSGNNNIIENNGETYNDFDSGGIVSSENPRLGVLQDNGGLTRTHALLAGSPAIDSGFDDENSQFDQRGFWREQDGNNDGIPCEKQWCR